jgi:3-oxoacyl-[acyl-carrier-protein] synthase II
MGEEEAGVDAARIALARIAAGQSDIALIGAAQNGERKDLLMLYEFGDFNLKDDYAPVFARNSKGGFALGSGSAFLVIESKAHAQARGARPYARLTKVVADMSRRRNPGDVTASMQTLWAQLGPVHDDAAIITGATGAQPATSDEIAFLRAHPGHPIRATATPFGHVMEAQFPLGIALAALSLSRCALYPPNDPTGLEIEASEAADQIVVIGAGHWRGEGMALVEAVS